MALSGECQIGAHKRKAGPVDKAKRAAERRARVSEHVEPIVETHMQVFHRLAAITNMHNPPQPRVKKSH